VRRLPIKSHAGLRLNVGKLGHPAPHARQFDEPQSLLGFLDSQSHLLAVLCALNVSHHELDFPSTPNAV
jgi:hypothetical protein